MAETHETPQRVLVADDSPMMRRIFLRSLEALGITSAVEAGDADEIVRLCEPGQFDVVLTDWNLPGRTGQQLIEAIRERDQTVPIILVTTEHERPRVARSITAEVSDYLTMPFTAAALGEKLDRLRR